MQGEGRRGEEKEDKRKEKKKKRGMEDRGERSSKKQLMDRTMVKGPDAPNILPLT